MADPMRSHVYDAQAEDVAFLVAHGASYEEACARVGVDPRTLTDRQQTRARRG